MSSKRDLTSLEDTKLTITIIWLNYPQGRIKEEVWIVVKIDEVSNSLLLNTDCNFTSKYLLSEKNISHETTLGTSTLYSTNAVRKETNARC